MFVVYSVPGAVKAEGCSLRSDKLLAQKSLSCTLRADGKQERNMQTRELWMVIKFFEGNSQVIGERDLQCGGNGAH